VPSPPNTMTKSARCMISTLRHPREKPNSSLVRSSAMMVLPRPCSHVVSSRPSLSASVVLTLMTSPMVSIPALFLRL
jgi:hypothetical protein